MPSVSHITAIDLFAGAGGLSLAASSLDVEVLAAVELDEWARATYERNLVADGQQYPKLHGDITELEPHALLASLGLTVGGLDILMGGPPCQGFSTHRIKGAGVGDERNELLLRYFLFVQVIQPKAFLVENVPGLLWPRHRRYLDAFISMADAAGYALHGPMVLNAKDYGVPQNRKRVFFVGIRSDVRGEFSWPEPTHFAPDSDQVRGQGRASWAKAGDVFQVALPENDPNAVHMNHSAKMVAVFRSTPLNGGSRHESCRVLDCHREHSGHKDVYGRIDPNRPGPTMTAACVNPSKGRFVHPTEHHGITVRHAARFQGFPDTFVFEGGLMAAGKQVGNAVPIGLGTAILRQVVTAIAD